MVSSTVALVVPIYSAISGFDEEMGMVGRSRFMLESALSWSKSHNFFSAKAASRRKR